MQNPVIIIHGWSDSAHSFKYLSSYLNSRGFNAVDVWLADYISLEDDVRVEDVAKMMEHVINQMHSPAAKYDLIVHSTGGLVAREWISTFYKGRVNECPVQRLIMLAPANFGSKLATLGQSMLGRVLKGWDNWFQTGKMMLDDLELASLYQWHLAQKDLFALSGNTSGDVFYGAGAIWPFVIIGSHPYQDALRRIVNENGADGTVRVPAANLNVKGLTIDFSVDELNPEKKVWPLRNDEPIPFYVLQNRTHSSVTRPDLLNETDNPDELGDLIVNALQCSDPAVYQQMAADWLSHSDIEPTPDTPEMFHHYAQFVIHVKDDHERDVHDYFLEFYGPEEDPNDNASVFFHREILREVHLNQYNPSYRCLFINRTKLAEYYKKIPDNQLKVLNMSISVKPPGENIRYFSQLHIGAEGHIQIHNESVVTGNWLHRNTTHFVEIIIPRVPSEKVFVVNKYIV
jgi:pimeloyl-ACP methyl ester carboxylesterase